MDYLLMSWRWISCFLVQESSKQTGKKAQKEQIPQYGMKTDNKHVPSQHSDDLIMNTWSWMKLGSSTKKLA